MRKLISTFLLCLIALGFSKAQTIFDPATFAGTLPSGMSIVTIDGKKYLQVVLNGWNSGLDIPTFTIGADRGVAVTFKYKKGATDTVMNLAKINATVQLKDTVNKIKNPWGEGLIPSDIGLTQNPPSLTFKRATGTFADTMDFVHQLQFSGQQQYDWGPITGDTMWVGKIYTINPNVLFDPATFDGTLPAGMEIVDDAGTKLLKVTVTGWNTSLDIDAFNMGNNNHWSMQAKLEAGTSGQTVAQLNTFIQAMVGGTGSFNVGAASSATLITYEGDAKPDVTVTALQFAAQQNYGDWHADTGAIIYVSKIVVSFVEPDPAPARNSYTVNYIPLTDFIDADGAVNPDEYWKNVTAANIDRQALPKDETPKITDSKGTMKLAWTEDYLYVLIEAEDATPINYPAASTKPWENDGAELFVDMKNRRYIGQKRISSEQHQLRFNLGRTDADTSAINYAGAKEKVIWGMQVAGAGWRLEAQIPWANLSNGAIPIADIDKFVADSIHNGKKIAWEVSIINANVADTRNSIMNWANDQKDDKAYTTNEFYGELTLSGASGLNHSSQTITISPNPVNNYIRTSENIISYSIFDLSGKAVLQGNNIDNIIDVSTLDKGIYIIKVVNNDNISKTGKFVKK